MRKLLLMLTAFLSMTGSLLAQKTITGKVIDDKGSPLANVSVVVKGTSTGTVTKADGTYSLTVPSSARVLVFSSVDMESAEMNIGSQTNISVTLKNADKSLTEVVVTGYTREKKSQFVGSATLLSSKVVETVPVGAFDQALQGRAPGLQVTSGSGQPGTSAVVTIRGVKTLNGAVTSQQLQPLYVIDGVPFPAFDMATINPNDFESITVLKDASAAALYGARGGLGVIVITTKRGKAGATNITYRTQVGFTDPPNWNKFDLMNTSEILKYEERLGMAGFTTNTPGWVYSKNNPAYAGLPATSPVSTPYSASQARYDFMLDSIGKINMYYPDILFRRGVSQTHEINVSGGAEKTRFFLSGGYFDQKGTDLSSRLRRYTTRFNLDFTADKFSVQFNNAMGYSITNYSEGEWLGNSARNSFQMAWRAKPYENPYRADGSLIYGASTSLALKQIGNVLEGIDNSLLRQNQIKINSSLTLAYKLLPYITLKNTVGLDLADDRWQRFINPASYIGSLQSLGASGINSEAYKLNAQLINTSAAIFSKRFGNMHDVEAGAYFEVVRGYQKALGFTMYNLDPRLSQTGQNAGPLPIAQTQQFATSAKSEFGIRSYFATARYTYNNKYTVNANIRRDGTSRILNDANKEITTWSAGLIWNAMEEGFMKSQGILTDLKLRASYGAVPNIGSISTGAYGGGGGLVNVTNYLGPQLPSFGSAPYAGSTLTGQAPTTPGNPELKIETVQKLNIGTDFSLWKNRARFIVDVYNEKTVDLFVANALPATAGFGSGFTTPINGGVMTNKGIEMSVSVDVVKNKNVDVTIGINHAINKNNIEDLGQVTEIPSGTFILREGLPYGSHYALHYLGADPATGRPMYYKQDGTTITYTSSEAGLFATFGTFIPKHVGGFTADIRFKAITVSALFSYQFDVSRYNNIENWITRGITGYHSAVNASRRLLTMQWQKPGDNALYQSPAYDRGFTSSDISDAKFLRFRNLNVAYNIPQLNIMKTKIIRSAKFYVQLQNIAIWSPWKGPDPEDNNNISLNEFPNPRMFVTGIDINF
ncbi:MAG: SusC/RagA family TonB-linked outer membrane protein [Chitinophagaceae bacterium]|nr:SusC/RagA family TonB-linked outer membrane protein [Chitinophagaceae bacterium]